MIKLNRLFLLGLAQYVYPVAFRYDGSPIYLAHNFIVNIIIIILLANISLSTLQFALIIQGY